LRYARSHSRRDRGNSSQAKKASLSGIDLSGANLSKADLMKADLSQADLWFAYLSEAYYDKFTKLPEGFDPEAAGVERIG
jgi:uncharacterized protein YjbI with pentapeptide repeats